MKISNTTPPLQSYLTMPRAKGDINTFAQVFAEANANKTNTDTISISDKKKHLPIPSPFGIKFTDIKDEPISVEDVLKNLKDDQKALLNEKYNIKDIKTDSDEYIMLMDDLRGMGVIVDSPYSLLLDMESFHLDEDGYLLCYTTKGDVSNNVVDRFHASLDYSSEKYFKLLESDSLSDEDKVFMKAYTYKQNVLSILEGIFSEQIDPKESA